MTDKREKEILWQYETILSNKGYSKRSIERYIKCVTTFLEWRKDRMLLTYTDGRYNSDLILFLDTFDFSSTINIHNGIDVRKEGIDYPLDTTSIDEKNFYIRALRILYVKLLHKKLIYVDYACPSKKDLLLQDHNRQRVVNFVTIFYYDKK